MTDSLLEFPCEFPIKMMGRDNVGFRDAAVRIIERHTGPIDDQAIRESTSSQGNFLAITVTIMATSQDQLDNIYRDLSDHELVLVAL
ncbi:MAG: YbeD family protein [Woeseiaceae bacterium]